MLQPCSEGAGLIPGYKQVLGGEPCPSEELLSGSSRDEGLVVLQDYSELSFHGDHSPNPP